MASLRRRGTQRVSPFVIRRNAVPYAQIDEGISLYYELTGPEEGPVIIQFGGGLFGRYNFGAVNDGFRESGFRLLSFDARGYGASTSPRENDARCRLPSPRAISRSTGVTCGWRRKSGAFTPGLAAAPTPHCAPSSL